MFSNRNINFYTSLASSGPFFFFLFFFPHAFILSIYLLSLHWPFLLAVSSNMLTLVQLWSGTSLVELTEPINLKLIDRFIRLAGLI